MHRTGYESVMWHIVKEQRFARIAGPALVALWVAGWLALAVTVFAPLD